jgi:hypothetical protein
MADLYSTDTLIGVVQGLAMPPSAILDRYFGEIVEEEDENIHFDLDIRYRLLAPFVSPLIEGKIMEERGQRTKTFRPAYVKPKTPLDPTRAVRRLVGEQIGGTLSPADRQRVRVANTIEDHIAYIRRRLEWMAVQGLKEGKVTVEGDGYPSVVVDFGRAAGLTITLSGNDLWSDEANADPIAKLHDWNELALKQVAGAALLDFIMDPDAFKAFRKHPKVKDKLDIRRERGSELEVKPMQGEGLTFMGTIDNFNIWLYQAWYEETIGTLVAFLASGTVIGASQAIGGVQHFGAIYDEGAGFRAMPFFPKSWVENDPPVRMVMTQSAPLPVPTRPNASLKASVL